MYRGTIIGTNKCNYTAAVAAAVAVAVACLPITSLIVIKFHLLHCIAYHFA
jgi:hypothetical protein